jgi:hypothetical protein
VVSDITPGLGVYSFGQIMNAKQGIPSMFDGSKSARTFGKQMFLPLNPLNQFQSRHGLTLSN